MLEPLRILSYNVRYFGHALRGPACTRATPPPHLHRPLLRTCPARPALHAHGQAGHRPRPGLAEPASAHHLPAGGGDLLAPFDARLPSEDARGDAARVVHGGAGDRLP